MKIEFDDLKARIRRERLRGKSSSQIAVDYFLPSAQLVDTIFNVGMQQEPLQLKLQQIEMDLMRCDGILDTFYNRALTGDRHAARIVIDTCKLRHKLLEDFPLVVEINPKEMAERTLENMMTLKEAEDELKSQISKLNEILKDFDF